MNQKFDVCARVNIDGREKPLFKNAGMTLIRRPDGKMFLNDARSGQTFYVFERTQNNGQAPQQQAPQPQPQPQQQNSSNFDDFDDDIPF